MSEGLIPEARSSSSVNRVIDSTPLTRLRHSSSIDRAPGKRPDMPTTAMLLLGSGSVSAILSVSLSSAHGYNWPATELRPLLAAALASIRQGRGFHRGTSTQETRQGM